ncbi:MAG: SDR family oxidoreductase [Gammaproteobacteria bacterium]|nr:SDR family oxidoreductase [Gammaproteobacteria bacterium]
MNTSFSLKNKVAVVTGGGSGIGLATVERFIAAGATVVMADLNDSNELANKVGATFIHVDVSKEQSVKDLLAQTQKTQGNIDILVNNAGICPPFKELKDTNIEDYEFAFKVNTLGVAFGLKYAPIYMNNGGSIINTASLSGKLGVFGLGAYSTSKFSVLSLTQTAAVELGERHIRVNAICPSSVDTPMAAENDQSQLEMEKIMIPLGRICQPEEAAALIHFLAADDCNFVNGQAINLCGGMTAGIGPKMWEKLAGSAGDK